MPSVPSLPHVLKPASSVVAWCCWLASSAGQAALGARGVRREWGRERVEREGNDAGRDARDAAACEGHRQFHRVPRHHAARAVAAMSNEDSERARELSNVGR